MLYVCHVCLCVDQKTICGSEDTARVSFFLPPWQKWLKRLCLLKPSHQLWQRCFKIDPAATKDISSMRWVIIMHLTNTQSGSPTQAPVKQVPEGQSRSLGTKEPQGWPWSSAPDLGRMPQTPDLMRLPPCLDVRLQKGWLRVSRSSYLICKTRIILTQFEVLWWTRTADGAEPVFTFAGRAWRILHVNRQCCSLPWKV